MAAYDLVVIGAGPGGYVCAIRAAQLGKKVAVVEKEPRLGGTCLNVGCIPSKALLESSEHVQLVRSQLEPHGICVESWHFDLATLMGRKDGIVQQLTDGIAMLMKKNRIDVVSGHGMLVSQGRVRVQQPQGELMLESAAVCLAMGSVAAQLDALPFDGKDVVSSTEALCFEEVPKHLVVVGAGAVGLELASVWKRLGAQVTVVEMLPTITPFADVQMAKILQKSLASQGIEIRLATQVKALDRRQGQLYVTVQSDQSDQSEIACDKVLVAVGRRARVQGAGLEEAGVELQRGKVLINDRFETNIPGVFAIGDLVRGPMLAHKASEEGVAVAETIAGKEPNLEFARDDFVLVPNVVYTEPELAQVGRTEAQLKQQQRSVKVGKFWYQANGRAKTMDREQGLIKLIADRDTDELVGAHIVGTRASELIGELALAMRLKVSVKQLADTVHVHPSLAEMIKEAALAVNRQAIHG